MPNDPSIGKRLKRILFPQRHRLKEIDARLRRLEDATDASLVLKRKADFAASPLFCGHMAALEATGASPAPTISTDLEFIAGDLRPAIADDDVSRAVICTVALGDAYRREIGPCLRSQREYAHRCGCAFADLAQPPSRLQRAASWYKLPLVYQLLARGYRRIAYIDADILITRPDLPVQKFFERVEGSKRDLLLTNDESGLNLGIFFAQGGGRLATLLDLIWNYDIAPGHSTWEQIGVRTLATEYPAFAARLLIEPDGRAFNSFPRERQEIHRLNFQASTWQPGDFACHFSGIRSPRLGRLIDQYLQRAGLVGA